MKFCEFGKKTKGEVTSCARIGLWWRKADHDRRLIRFMLRIPIIVRLQNAFDPQTFESRIVKARPCFHIIYLGFGTADNKTLYPKLNFVIDWEQI